MVSHKSVAKKIASAKSERNTRIDAVRNALTSYFLGSTETTELFWKTANPSLGKRSPSYLVKAGRLSKLEQYVTYLRKHTRCIQPQIKHEPTPPDVVAFEGKAEAIRERLKEPSAVYGFIVVAFPNAESFHTQAPLYRLIIDRLPEILQRQQHREQLLYARLLYSFTADLPVKVPKQQLRRVSNRKN